MDKIKLLIMIFYINFTPNKKYMRSLTLSQTWFENFSLCTRQSEWFVDSLFLFFCENKCLRREGTGRMQF